MLPGACGLLARRENCEDPKVKVWLPPLTREGMYGTETKQLGYGHKVTRSGREYRRLGTRSQASPCPLRGRECSVQRLDVRRRKLKI